MATQIVISRIQHRRGLRENLPQPLRPGELALTADSRQVWIGGDPNQTPIGILVYADKDVATAQTILDTIIVETRFDSAFDTNMYNSVLNALVNSPVMTFVTDDIIRDTTFRTNPPNTFEGYSIYILADQTIDVDNTIANINAAIAGTSAAGSFIESNYVGDLALFGGDFDGDGYLILDTHGQANAIATLTNRAYSPAPNDITGLVTTNLNIEIGTGGGGGGGFSGPVPYEIGFFFSGATVTPDFLYGTYVAANSFEFEDGSTSHAYTNTVSSADQTFDLQQNGVSFGTVDFTTGNAVGSVTIPAPVTFAAGDRLDVIGPSIPDGVISGIAITLNGLLQVI